MTDQASATEQILAALEHTVSRGSARITLRCEIALPDEVFASASRGPRQQGGSPRRRLRRAAGHAAGQVFYWGSRRVLEHYSKPMMAGADGVLDLASHRCVSRYPGLSKSELIVEDRRWYGEPGTAVDGLTAGRASATQPLWLLDLIRGVTDAQEHAPEEVDGASARRFSAQADLHRAAAAVSYRMALPSNTTYLDELAHIAVGC